MIDIHCHILPGIDDGANSIATSIEMMKIAKVDGIHTIIATPHYNEIYYSTEFSEIVKYSMDMTKISNENNIGIRILPGQEISISRPVLKLYKEGKVGCLNNTRYMLLELNYNKFDNKDLDIIYELRVCGVVPVIAHPERYSYIIHKPYLINSISAEGCLFQINEGSIKGTFGRDIKKTADLLIRHGICNFIASDSHGVGRRSPKLKSTYENIEMNLRRKIEKNLDRLLSDNEINYDAEVIREKRSIFDIFKR